MNGESSNANGFVSIDCVNPNCDGLFTPVGSLKITGFFIAISYLSMMAWAFFFALVLEMLLRIPVKYSVAILAIVMAYAHFRTITYLQKKRQGN